MEGEEEYEELCFRTSSSCREVREREKHLPIANVSKIMKIAVPNKFKISKEAKHTLQICVSEFISFVTNEANDKCMKEKRKAITGEHVLWAISTLGFEDYVEPLKLYLRKYRKGGARALAKEGGIAAASQVPQGSFTHVLNYMNSQVNGSKNNS